MVEDKEFLYQQKMKRIQDMLINEFDAEAFILMFKAKNRESLDAINFITNGSQIFMLFEMYIKLGGRVDEFVAQLIQKMKEEQMKLAGQQMPVNTSVDPDIEVVPDAK